MSNTGEVAFIVESRASAGLGHMRRTVVLADELRRRGWNCRFYVTELGNAVLIQRAGFQAERYEGVPIERARVVVLDGYDFPVSVIVPLRDSGSLVVVIDDLAQQPVEADVVINHNVYGPTLDYKPYRASVVMAGADYALIASEFCMDPARARDGNQRVLVSFGGSDDGRYGFAVAKEILRSSASLNVELVIARKSQAATADHELNGFEGRLTLHYGADMVQLMRVAKYYVGAAGVTLLEALAAGLEVVVCAIAENQLLNIRMLQKMGLPAFEEFDKVEMAAALASQRANSNRAKYPRVDGQGPARVASGIEAMIGT